LGVIRAAWEQGKRISVYASETRPRLQGAKLTVFELMSLEIPVKVLTDNMVAYLMSRGEIKKVVVGADRILARTGHVINKIGTLSAAVNAHHFKIPFYVAAPLSTVDRELTPDTVVIEHRSEDEVHYIGRTRITPKGARAVNPAFDITPPELVTAIITEKGVFPPSELAKFMFG
jgi:methylthioribose-1-phosphate isomerase